MHSETNNNESDVNASIIDPEIVEYIRAVRHFNRLYAEKIGAFNERIFGSDLSLTEVRVIYELSIHSPTTATFLSKNLSLDCGYLSRILNRFEVENLVVKERSLKDARQRTISLTKKGAKLAASISQSADQSVHSMLKPLSKDQQAAITNAMASILAILGVSPTTSG